MKGTVYIWTGAEDYMDPVTGQQRYATEPYFGDLVFRIDYVVIRNQGSGVRIAPWHSIKCIDIGEHELVGGMLPW